MAHGSKHDESDDQIGSAFGSALAACDVDNDGVDELLVGAPQRRGPLPDQGRVYVYRIQIDTPKPIAVIIDFLCIFKHYIYLNNI